VRLQHYLGGLENLGPVNFFEKKVFMAEWEKRIFGIHTVMMAESAHLANALQKYPIAQVPTTFKDTWTWASLRTGAEGMQPFEYFKYRYYEKWLMGISQFLSMRLCDADELATRSNTKSILTRYRLTQPATQRTGGRYSIMATWSADNLRLLALPSARSSTLLIRQPPITPDYQAYVTRKTPKCIRRVHFVSTGQTVVGPQHVYCASFNASDIWGADKSEPHTIIYADLFEAYLKSAQ
jgi:nitrile hydratase